MQVLIEGKAVVDQVDENGATPLYMASQEGHVEEGVKVLIKAKAAQSTKPWTTAPLRSTSPHRTGMPPSSECSSKPAPVPWN